MIIVVRASARKEGKSNQLVDRVLKDIKDDVVEYDLNQLKIKGCSGCRACKQSKKLCVIKDDLNDFFMNLKDADYVIYASPNYMGEMSGQLKLLFDRHYSLTDMGGKSKLNHIKSGVLLFTQGYQDESYYKATYEKYLHAFNKQLNTQLALMVYGGDELLSDQVMVNEKISIMLNHLKEEL